MKISTLAVIAFASSASAFAPAAFTKISTTSLRAEENSSALDFLDGNVDISAEILSQMDFQAGKADTELAKRFGHLAGAKIKTVGEAFADFSRELGYTVNPLYKNMVTDIVGTTHLNVVNARFQRDQVWCLGIITTLEVLLKNYPEQEVGQKIVSSFFKSIGMDEAEVRSEAAAITEFVQGKSKDEIEAILDSGDSSTPLGAIAANIKGDKFWMYSRYFGIGLVKIMELVGIEMEKDEVYPVMESWMQDKLGRSPMVACSDSDLFFRVKDKLDMMETMMKEIEIREKKRLAERLEEKAEAALRAAEKEKIYQAAVDEEKAKLDKETVQ